MSFLALSRRCLLVFVQLTFLVCIRYARASDLSAIHIRNFGEVDPGVFRGGEPHAAQLTELKALGVRLIVDLRETSYETKAEQNEADRLGIQYVNIPFPPWSAPSKEQMGSALGWLVQASESQRIFIHCRRGKDRTGTVIACFRIQHDGWSAERALDEADNFGMSHLERSMRSYILRFHPAGDPPALSSR